MNKARSPWQRRVAFLVGIGLGIFFAQARQIDDYPKHLMNPPNAQYAIVLGARTEGGQPTPVFQERIRAALELYRDGKVRKILFTGQPGEPPQALVARRIALEAGVPETDILVETRSRRTLENLRFARELLADPEQTTVLIISDPLHLKRAMLMATDLGLQAFPAPATSTRVRSLRNRMKFLFRETFAMLFYRIERWF